MYDTIQKTIVAWAFNHYIAYYYFDNVNLNQLKVAFEKGEVELENLPIKKEALRHLNLPMDVVSGIVGKLRIKIPILTLLRDPWTINITNLMLIVAPKHKQSSESDDKHHGGDDSASSSTSGQDDSVSANNEANEQTNLDSFLHGSGDASLVDYLDNTTLDDIPNCAIVANSEETKLAEFYSSFSATVSSMVRDIYRNLHLEIDSMTILFQNFDNGLVKLSIDNLLLHRPKSVRNLILGNISLHLSSTGPPIFGADNDLFHIHFDSCNVDIYDEASNWMFIFNIEDGLVYIVNDNPNTCATPTLEFTLNDCRILHFSGQHQQNGFIFAKIGCNIYNRESSLWETFLHPWPFNLSWDFKTNTSSTLKNRRPSHKVVSLTSEETASFILSSSFIDLCDVALKRIVVDYMNPRSRALSTSCIREIHNSSFEFKSVFVIHNETGHRLFFAPIEQNSELFDINELSNSLIVSGSSGDTVNHTIIRRLSSHNKSPTSNSPDSFATRWSPVEPGDTVPFEYETMPIYRRHFGESNAQCRVLLIRVEGWKTLLPVVIDKTGLFFREAYSDRVVNEDTIISISIDLEEGSARKIISVRSPLNLINHLDATLEIHFAEARQALYIKPNNHLAVPLPFLHNRMHIRPCNVGVTMSEQALTWEKVQNGPDHTSKIHICHPITITDRRHASYCTSQSYRICVSAQREYSRENIIDDNSLRSSIPVFSVTLNPPLTIVNLLPCSIEYSIGDINGQLTAGHEEKINQVDTTKDTEMYITIDGFPRSKPINIDPGATGSFYQTIELLDKKNRSLYLKAKINLTAFGEEPALQIMIYSPYWLINKTGLPLIFKQVGAALEAAGQYREHEESSNSILLFSFYDTELEPPWLCTMRLGQSEAMWCDGFKLEKGVGERRLYYNSKGLESNKMKHMIDIDIRRAYGRYSETTIVTFNVRYGFDPLTKTPKKAPVRSPNNYKLASYNHNTNLSERIACQAVNLFGNNFNKRSSDVNVVLPGFNIILLDKSRDKLVDASIKDVVFKCSTKAREQIIDCTIQDVRIENSLPDCENCVMLDRIDDSNVGIYNRKPAIRLIMDRVLGSSFGATLFRQVQLTTCELILNIEEKLILKLVEFVSLGRRRRQLAKDLLHDLEKNLQPDGDRRSKYYFDLLRIDLTSVHLSSFTSSNLPDALQMLKSYLGLKFFSFEDAKLQLSPYIKMNVSRTLRGVFESVTRFYKKQILEQAPRIVGQQIQSYLRFHLSDLLSTLYDEVYNKLFN